MNTPASLSTLPACPTWCTGHHEPWHQCLDDRNAVERLHASPDYIASRGTSNDDPGLLVYAARSQRVTLAEGRAPGPVTVTDRVVILSERAVDLTVTEARNMAAAVRVVPAAAAPGLADALDHAANLLDPPADTLGASENGPWA